MSLIFYKPAINKMIIATVENCFSFMRFLFTFAQGKCWCQGQGHSSKALPPKILIVIG